MQIIDAHIHFSNINSFIDTAKELSNVDYSAAGYKDEFKKNNVMKSIGMGLTEQYKGGFPDRESPNPMLLDLENKLPRGLYTCIGVNPIPLADQTKELELRNIEEQLMNDSVVGIKIYAGYYHFHVYDEVYQPIYALAAKHQLPVVIHSGDTYSDRGLLKYSHPLNIDELAVSHRDIDFIIAHLGDPWVMDCAEVISKNPNVYADLSGLIVGDAKQVNKFMNERLFMDHIKRALVYTDNYRKLLFGSDWPLVDLEAYIQFVKALVPVEFHEDVFYHNAIRVFGL
ncbi:amidohydrolase family protein [Vallitalea okinawensis]|uniref:amidohydrolase family protein n=1 Tax=Vallitalea okinawensis TaxID=2078660 RepID=UPI000CFD05A0|nr:TatD family hydrolase [Vallitalea okinawensis]